MSKRGRPAAEPVKTFASFHTIGGTAYTIHCDPALLNGQGRPARTYGGAMAGSAPGIIAGAAHRGSIRAEARHHPLDDVDRASHSGLPTTSLERPRCQLSCIRQRAEPA